jgi:hypothetical protein
MALVTSFLGLFYSFCVKGIQLNLVYRCILPVSGGDALIHGYFQYTVQFLQVIYRVASHYTCKLRVESRSVVAMPYY